MGGYSSPPGIVPQPHFSELHGSCMHQRKLMGFCMATCRNMGTPTMRLGKFCTCQLNEGWRIYWKWGRHVAISCQHESDECEARCCIMQCSDDLVRAELQVGMCIKAPSTTHATSI